MARHGFMIEKRINAKDVEALNRSAKSVADIDGGMLVKLGEYADGVWNVTKATEGEGLYMAYNPSEHFTNVNGRLFVGLTKDPRDYTNLAGRTFDIFKLTKGDIVGITAELIKASDVATVAKGKFLEQGADGYEKKDSATASTTSLKVIDIENMVAVDVVQGFYYKPLETDELSKCEPFCYEMPLTNYYLKRMDAEVIGNIFDNPELLESEG